MSTYDNADLSLLQRDFNSLTDDKKRTVLSLPVEALDPSVRSYNCLLNSDIKCIGELIQHTEAGMLRIRNFGRKSLREVKFLLSSNSGLQLGLKIDPKTMLPCGPISPGDDIVPYDSSKVFGAQEAYSVLHNTIEVNLMGSRPAASAHESYSWVAGELQHLWWQICSDHPDKHEMKDRAMRAAALLVRFCLDICQE
jgi:hypothetical protein